MLNNEIWKEIDDLPYEVSNKGNVRRMANSAYKQKAKKYVKPYINNKGYVCINLYKEGKCYKFQIHRLIAIYFIANPNNLPIINHEDGVTTNNDIGNLEWCTQKQNIQHAWDTGLFTNRHTNASVKRKNSSSKYKGVSWSKERKKWCVCLTVDKKRIALGRYEDEIEAAKIYDNYINENNLQAKGYSTNFV